ncbi:MAG: hypothetical protein K6G16_05945 [Lachnospiraceae bacterium]|nr:hypothetical protein [Lachnospiraceae bacterium]
MIAHMINLTIFLITLIILILFFRKDGKWDTERAKKAFRYFTVLSNTFCAIAALLMCINPENRVFWMLKYVGTVAVTVTMLTVFIFLMPAYKTITGLLKGYDLFMHLLTPVMAAVSLCVFERHPIGMPVAACGVIPVIVYGVWYLYQIIYAPEEKRWEDFYRFNMGGRWPISFVSMLTGTFLICLGYWAILRLPV